MPDFTSDFVIDDDTLKEYRGSSREVVVPEGITRIGYAAFRDHKEIVSVHIPQGVTEISTRAFSGCSSLINVAIPDSVTVIGERAFEECGNLADIVIPNGVVQINRQAFKSCSGLTGIVIPDSVLIIEDLAFEDCEKLSSITLPESVRYLGRYAFKNCPVKELFVTSIEWFKAQMNVFSDAFSGNIAVTQIDMPAMRSLRTPTTGDLKAYARESDGTAFDISKDGYLRKYCGSAPTVVIPDGVTVIGYDSFAGHTEITSIVIPVGVTRIEDDAFERCVNLRSVIIPGSVVEIGFSAFMWCTGLQEAVIADSVTKMGDQVFKGCCRLESISVPNRMKKIALESFLGCKSLGTAVIPEGVTEIGAGAFEGCINLKSIIIPDSVTDIGSGAFKGCQRLESIHIPYGVSELDNTFEGCVSLTTVSIPNSVTKIGFSAFDGCTDLADVAIPSSVTHIESFAFKGCRSLSGITLPDGITYIGQGAFEECGSLTAIKIPNGVSEIGFGAFQDCFNLKSVSLPNSVIKLGACAFSGCTNLESITSLGRINAIWEYTFIKCRSLRSITIPDSVTGIGNFALAGCSSLTEIVIPDSVTTVGRGAFGKCTSLTHVTIPDSVEQISSDALKDCPIQEVTASLDWLLSSCSVRFPEGTRFLSPDSSQEDIQPSASAVKEQTDFEKALVAAKQGDPEGQYYVGVCYQTGKDGVPVNKEEAWKWLKMAADAGNTDALYYLGLCCFKRNGFEDSEEGIYYLNLASNRGHKDAQLQLANCYWDGISVEQDRDQAIEWYERAARLGNADAQFKLGLIYLSQEQGYTDAERSAYWFELAAEHGNVEAQKQTASNYLVGNGVEENEERALYWLELAALHGDEQAINALRKLSPNRAVLVEKQKAQSQAPQSYAEAIPIPVKSEVKPQERTNLGRNTSTNTSATSAKPRKLFGWLLAAAVVVVAVFIVVRQAPTLFSKIGRNDDPSGKTINASADLSFDIPGVYYYPDSDWVPGSGGVGLKKHLTKDVDCVWSSTDTSVAYVNQDGYVAYMGVGTATIKAISTIGTASCEVVIHEPGVGAENNNVPSGDNSPSLAVTNGTVTSITLSCTDFTLSEAGDSYTIYAVVSPMESNAVILWSSSNPDVATVDQAGTVTAVNHGTTVITAAAGNVKETCFVGVIGRKTSWLDFAEYPELEFIPAEEDIYDDYVYYYVSVSGVLNMRSGPDTRYNLIEKIPSNTMVSAVSEYGEWYLVFYNGIFGWVHGGYLTTDSPPAATPAVVDSIVLSRSDFTLTNVGDTYQFNVTIFPAQAQTDIVWTSDDPNVVAVSADGIVTAVSKGTTTVHATSGGVTADCIVRVEGKISGGASEGYIKPYTIKYVKAVEGYNEEAGFGINDYGEHVCWNVMIVMEERPDGDISKQTSWGGIITSDAMRTGDYGWKAASAGNTLFSEYYLYGGDDWCIEIVLPDDPSIAGDQWILLGGSTRLEFSLEYLGNYSTGLGWNLEMTSYEFSNGDVITVGNHNSSSTTVNSIVLSRSDFTLTNVGDTYQFNVTIFPAQAQADIVWTSDDPNVAAVSADGTVTAVSRGTTTVHATAGSVTAECIIRVQGDGAEGKTADETNDTAEWDAFLLVDVFQYEGILAFVYNGEEPQTHFIRLGNYEGTSEIYIIPKEIEGIPVTEIGEDTFRDNAFLCLISIPDSVLEIGKDAFARCSCLRDVYYAGSKEDWERIHIEDGNYLLTDAYIEFNNYDDYDFITLNYGDVTIHSSTNDSFYLKAYGAVEGAEVIYSSGDESVATVDSNGLVKAISNGTTYIHVIVNTAEWQGVEFYCTVRVVE